MLLATPDPTSSVTDAITATDELTAKLHDLDPPRRWIAVLRRSAKAEATASSVAIEGFHVDRSSAESVLAGQRRPANIDEDMVAAYGRAMDHVVALADDPLFKWNHRVIADLHFDLAWPEPNARPGRLRTKGIGITAADGALAYTAPGPDEARALTAELVTWLRKPDPAVPVMVRAAMAHLHLVSIHPFVDGNGRASRVLQSLVLALDGKLVPELASIEAYLAANTEAYYAALQAAHGTSYDASMDAAPWIEFCAKAHLETAHARVALIDAAAGRWSSLERLAGERHWPDRFVIALEQSLTGQLDRARYVTEAGVSPATATTDLRRLVDAGLLAPEGAGPSTRYRGTDALREVIA